MKKHDTFIDNCPIIIYINKKEKRTTFKMKTGCHLKRLTP